MQTSLMGLALPATTNADRNAALKDASIELEATFLAEMLKAAGLNTSASSFSGGIGEDQFNSLMTREYALQIARNGGIGLAEAIFQSLVANQHD